MLRNLGLTTTAAAMVLLGIAAPAAHAADVKLPPTVSWSVYGVGTGSYNEAVAQSSAIKKRFGTELRLLPSRNDISRMAPLRAGKVDFSAMSSGVMFAEEGVFDFGTPAWGPQPIQVVAVNLFPGHSGVFVSKKSGIKTMADLKGKRVPWVRGAPSLQQLVVAYLAFANLTTKDVKLVQVPGFSANLEAFLKGQTDVVIANTLSPVAQRAEASPYGPISWPPFPRSNEAGWARMTKLLPYLRPTTISDGVGIPKDFQGITYALPILVAYAKKDPDVVYNMTKAVFESYPEYKNAVPSAKGWKLSSGSTDYPVAYHPGAVKYYREKGLWTAEDEARNEKLLKRQKVLSDAWDAEKKKGLSGEAFDADWRKARVEALTKAGFDPIWK